MIIVYDYDSFGRRGYRRSALLLWIFILPSTMMSYVSTASLFSPVSTTSNISSFEQQEEEDSRKKSLERNLRREEQVCRHRMVWYFVIRTEASAWTTVNSRRDASRFYVFPEDVSSSLEEMFSSCMTLLLFALGWETRVTKRRRIPWYSFTRIDCMEGGFWKRRRRRRDYSLTTTTTNKKNESKRLTEGSIDQKETFSWKKKQAVYEQRQGFGMQLQWTLLWMSGMLTRGREEEEEGTHLTFHSNWLEWLPFSPWDIGSDSRRMMPQVYSNFYLDSLLFFAIAFAACFYSEVNLLERKKREAKRRDCCT